MYNVLSHLNETGLRKYPSLQLPLSHLPAPSEVHFLQKEAQSEQGVNNTHSHRLHKTLIFLLLHRFKRERIFAYI